MTRLLLDQGLPRSAAVLLREGGLDAVHVGEIGMSQATDTEIIALARVQDRVVITLDADFHTLLALGGVGKPSVVRIRIEGLKSAEMTRLILRVLQLTQDQLDLGAAVVVTATNIRIRLLPIG